MPYPTVIQVTKNDSMTFREPPLSSLRCILCCVNVAHAAGVRPHQGERAADRRVLGWQRHPRCAHRRGDAAIKCRDCPTSVLARVCGASLAFV